MKEEIKVIDVFKSKTEEEKTHKINKIIARLICKFGTTENYKITMKQSS